MSGERLVLWWVDRYTRGVAEATRAERRAELASDVWEHRAATDSRFAAELAIVSRCLRGVPADVLWRRELLGRSRASSALVALRGLGWAVGVGAFLLLVLVHAQHAGPVVGLPSVESPPSGNAVQEARPSALLLVLLVVGALLLVTHPRLGAALVAAGAWGTAAWLWCIVLLFGPIALAATTAAAVLAWRRVRHSRPTAPG